MTSVALAVAGPHLSTFGFGMAAESLRFLERNHRGELRLREFPGRVFERESSAHRRRSKRQATNAIASMTTSGQSHREQRHFQQVSGPQLNSAAVEPEEYQYYQPQFITTQHKNKRPVHVPINQQTVNGLMSLLLLFSVSVFGCLGNVFLISTLTVIESLQTRGNCYLVSIALAHLLVTLFVIPSSAVRIMAGEFISSRELCHYQWLTLEFCLIVAQMSFFLIACDSYLGYKPSEKVTTHLNVGAASSADERIGLAASSADRATADKRLCAATPTAQLSPDPNRRLMSKQTESNEDKCLDWSNFCSASLGLIGAKQRLATDTTARGHQLEKPKAVTPSPLVDANRRKQLKASSRKRIQLAQQFAGRSEATLEPRGCLVYRDCCGRLRVLLWISAVWLVALTFAWHRHTTNAFGPTFCDSPASWKRPENQAGPKSNGTNIVTDLEPATWDQRVGPSTLQVPINSPAAAKSPDAPSYRRPVVSKASRDQLTSPTGDWTNSLLESQSTTRYQAATRASSEADRTGQRDSSIDPLGWPATIGGRRQRRALEIQTYQPEQIIEPSGDKGGPDQMGRSSGGQTHTQRIIVAGQSGVLAQLASLSGELECAKEATLIDKEFRGTDAASGARASETNHNETDKDPESTNGSSTGGYNFSVWLRGCRARPRGQRSAPDSSRTSETSAREDELECTISIPVNWADCASRLGAVLIAASSSHKPATEPTSLDKTDSCHRNSAETRATTSAVERSPAARVECILEAATETEAQTGLDYSRHKMDESPLDFIIQLASSSCDYPASVSLRRRVAAPVEPDAAGRSHRLAIPAAEPLGARQPLRSRRSLSSDGRGDHLTNAHQFDAQLPGRNSRLSVPIALTVADNKPSNSTEDQQQRAEHINSNSDRNLFWLVLISCVVWPSMLSLLLFARAYLKMKEFKTRPYKPMPLALLDSQHPVLMPHSPVPLIAQQQTYAFPAVADSTSTKTTAAGQLKLSDQHAASVSSGASHNSLESGGSLADQQPPSIRPPTTYAPQLVHRPLEQVVSAPIFAANYAAHELHPGGLAAPRSECFTGDPMRRLSGQMQPVGAHHRRPSPSASYTPALSTRLAAPEHSARNQLASISPCGVRLSYPHQAQLGHSTAIDEAQCSWSAPPSATFRPAGRNSTGDGFLPLDGRGKASAVLPESAATTSFASAANQPADVGSGSQLDASLVGHTTHGLAVQSGQTHYQQRLWSHEPTWREQEQRNYEFRRSQVHAQSFHYGSSTTDYYAHNGGHRFRSGRNQRHPEEASPRAQLEQPPSDRLEVSGGVGAQLAGAVSPHLPPGGQALESRPQYRDQWLLGRHRSLPHSPRPRPADSTGQPALASGRVAARTVRHSIALANVIKSVDENEAPEAASGCALPVDSPERPLMAPESRATSASSRTGEQQRSVAQPRKAQKVILCTYFYMTEDQLLRSNLIVFLVQLTLWLPFVLLSIASQFRDGNSMRHELRDSVWWLAALNCCSCSYVYALSNKDFRDAYNKLFYYCCCKSHVTFPRRTPIFRRQLELDARGNLRVHIIPGLNLYSNKLSLGDEPLNGAQSQTHQHHAGGHQSHNHQQSGRSHAIAPARSIGAKSSAPPPIAHQLGHSQHQLGKLASAGLQRRKQSKALGLSSYLGRVATRRKK